MSEHDELRDDNENEPDGFDELTEEFRADQDDVNESDFFATEYGFEHDCRCADDWEEGNLGVVSVCYLDMCKQALEALAATRKELSSVRAELAQIQLEKLGS